MLHRLAQWMLGPVARSGDLALDADMQLVMPVNGTCAAVPALNPEGDQRGKVVRLPARGAAGARADRPAAATGSRPPMLVRKNRP